MPSLPARHPEPRGLSFVMLAPPTGDLNHFVLRVKTTNDGVIVQYGSLPANQPHTFGNSVALWNSTIPNLQSKPLATSPIPDDSETGDVHIPFELQQTNYSITYQTLGVSTICALAQIRLAPAAAPIPMFVSMSIACLDSAELRVIYSTLPGYTPAAFNNWIGLWQGFESPYSGTPPLQSVRITQDFTQGEVTIPFAAGPFEYTLIYFLGEDRRSAGALLYFQPQPENFSA